MTRKRKKNKYTFSTISPNEIFLDSENVSGFDYQQLEGRMEKPIRPATFLFFGAVFMTIGLFLLGRVGYLQVVKGSDLKERAENNHLRAVFLPAERGLIYDRNGDLLAWNELGYRTYKNSEGLSHIVGYIGAGRDSMTGKEGAEESYENILCGQKGIKLVEVDSLNETKTESIQQYPITGKNIQLSIDARMQEKLYEIFSGIAESRGFQGAAGVVLNVKNGEVLSLVSYPEYMSQVLSGGEQKEKIDSYIQDDRKPFLNRAVSGLYAPGSIIKPFVAIAALNEGIVDPEKQIFSSGSISIPNPYFPEKESVFYDWKAHGWVNMKEALAVSCNVYFYSIGGGYGDIAGLGIRKIANYVKMFGLGEKMGISLSGETAGVVPSPKPGEIWRVGDTYNASIGQGDFQVTPLQMALATAALANEGVVVKPHILLNEKDANANDNINISKEYFKIVKEGMREAVLTGTARALSDLPVKIAAKTGTAELGSGKFVNSWLIAFWPFDNPQFAMSLVLEKGSSSNLIGGVSAAHQLLQWVVENAPEYK